MQFEILKKSRKSRARLGIIKTANGVLHTPAFFPVATQATVKTLTSEDLKQIGFEGILANTYHLHLRPGEKTIAKLGGLHQFMNFPGVIATDSGGFQVFSLGAGISLQTSKIPSPALRKTGRSEPPSEPKRKEVRSFQNSFVKITEEGVYFKSHIDGSKQFISPEISIQIQKDLGANLIFAFDQPSSPLDDYEATKSALDRTNRWATRCLAQISNVKCQISKPYVKSQNSEKENKKQGLFGIVQGGKYKDLRIQSAKFISGLDFDGIGIGGSFGESYGDSKKNLLKVLDWTIPLLPQEKPRHLLGIGHLDDLEKAIACGIDLFDCVHPTRLARHGTAITKNQNLTLTKTEFLLDKKPIDKTCQCFVCQNYSRAYLSHLLRAGETTGQRLLTYHNLWFFKNFIDDLKKKIASNRL